MNDTKKDPMQELADTIIDAIQATADNSLRNDRVIFDLITMAIEKIAQLERRTRKLESELNDLQSNSSGMRH